MKPLHIKELQVKRPFVPFRLRLADGSSYEIHHPELLWVTNTLIGIASGIDQPTTGVPEDVVLCSPEHIVSAELLRKSKAR